MSGIVVIGSLNMDLVISTPKLPALGETVLGGGFFTASGGKGANQSVAAARLGGRVSMVGCVGDDLFGRELLQNLTVNNVNTEHVKILENAPTGIAMITVKDGDNCIIVDPGANGRLSPEMAEEAESLIKESAVVVIQLEIPVETVIAAAELAKKHGVKVLLNPAPARPLPDELLANIDILTPNEKECAQLAGLPITTVEEAKAALAMLRRRGVPQVIITMGSAGVVYNSREEIIHKPAYPVRAVDTTAAGDCFTGALAVALTEGKSIDEAVRFANAAGALAVTKAGAQTSLPTREEVEEFIKCR